MASRDGTHYIVNGEKKWITGGRNADYFTVGGFKYFENMDY